ncbi:MAG: SDR family oxidoreductase [Candidatus Binataceae bacterium]|nr:SDR family oxidoreductase [Candidatus Binataceae bacterium]
MPSASARTSDDPNQEIARQVAVVTGAGRGVGRAVAIALAEAGFSLCLAARTQAELEETRALSGLPSERSLIVLIDLAAEEAAEHLIGAAVDYYGCLDVLVNNAGWAPPRTPLIKMTGADQDRIIALNLRAPIALARLAASHMSERNEGGVIVNIASAAARRMGAGEAIYAAAKAGLIAFTHASFAELRERHIKTSVIIPGLIDTGLIPVNKRLDRTLMLRPADVAAAVMSVVAAPSAVCPLELVLEPQRDPLRTVR